MEDQYYIEQIDKKRGSLYKDHTYTPTNFELEADLLYMHHTDGGITEVLHSIPEESKSEYVFVMVPGFITILDSWEVFLQGIKDKFEIYYWESREKGTFHPPRQKLKRSDFSKDRFMADLIEFVEAAELPERKYILAGSSFGGTLMIDALSQKLIEPDIAILIGANIHFHIPFPGNILMRIIPAGLISFFKPLMRWYLRNFEVDRETDEVQYQKYVKAIELANFSFIKHTVINYHRHPQEDILKDIAVPTIVVGAKLDKMHTIAETKFTTEEIPHAEMAVFETNKETHSEPFVQYITERYTH